ncbi:MAG: hypothetical protein JWO60_2626, partial [Frankiales bacterium]|nr:hypothetical protein [Frankiales bacterium]
MTSEVTPEVTPERLARVALSRLVEPGSAGLAEAVAREG